MECLLSVQKKQHRVTCRHPKPRAVAKWRPKKSRFYWEKCYPASFPWQIKMLLCLDRDDDSSPIINLSDLREMCLFCGGRRRRRVDRFSSEIFLFARAREASSQGCWKWGLIRRSSQASTAIIKCSCRKAFFKLENCVVQKLQWKINKTEPSGFSYLISCFSLSLSNSFIFAHSSIALYFAATITHHTLVSKTCSTGIGVRLSLLTFFSFFHVIVSCKLALLQVYELYPILTFSGWFCVFSCKVTARLARMHR